MMKLLFTLQKVKFLSFQLVQQLMILPLQFTQMLEKKQYLAT